QIPNYSRYSQAIKTGIIHRPNSQPDGYSARVAVPIWLDLALSFVPNLQVHKASWQVNCGYVAHLTVDSITASYPDNRFPAPDVLHRLPVPPDAVFWHSDW